ncbi:MAG TPA: Rieske 2Fe-2S domain-containing protein [Alloacidobacterium sp.]|nr:Rieske 2Fe-2S domain-containing protein [Alloacidobacterium sp.]
MAEFVRICAKSELPPSGQAREMALGSRMLCLANENGVISAMDNVCPHRGGPLGQGIIENGKVICPLHAWAFDLKTGAVQHAPHMRVAVYEVKVESEDVFVQLG